MARVRQYSDIGRILSVDGYLSLARFSEMTPDDLKNKRFVRLDRGEVYDYTITGAARKYNTFLPLLLKTKGGRDNELLHLSTSGAVYNVVPESARGAPYALTFSSSRRWTPSQVSAQADKIATLRRGDLVFVSGQVPAFNAAGSSTYANRAIYSRADQKIRTYDTAGQGYEEGLQESPFLFCSVAGNRRRLYFTDSSTAGSAPRAMAPAQTYLTVTRRAFLGPGAIYNSRHDGTNALSSITGLMGEELRYINGQSTPQEITSSLPIINTLRQTGGSIIVQPGVSFHAWRAPNPNPLVSTHAWQFEESPGRVTLRDNTPDELLPGYVPPPENSAPALFTSDAMYSAAPMYV